MTEPFAVTRYQDTDRDGVFELLRVAHPAGRAATLIRQWDWKYLNNPFNGPAGPHILLIKDGIRTIGMIAGMAMRARIGESEHGFVNSGDWVVDPEYRGRAIGRLAYRQYITEQPLGIGWANSVSGRLARPTPGTDTRRIYPMVTLAGLPRRSPPTGGGNARIAEVLDPDERFDGLWQSASHDYPVMSLRHRRFLKWRFFSRPGVEYTVLAAAHGDLLLGYLVLRLAQRGRAVRAYLVDWLVKDKSTEVLSLLARDAIARARQAGARFVIVRTATPSLQPLFRRLGFAHWYFGPPEYFVVRLSSPDPRLAAFGRIDNWFFTMGDGDVEMGF